MKTQRMDRLSGSLFGLLVWCSFLTQPLGAKVDFGSKNSTIKLRSGSMFNVASPSVKIDGSLERPVGASVLGQSILFQNGVLESAGAQGLLTGFYNGSLGKIFLTGNHVLDAEPGLLIESIEVRGQNNRLEGQPLFTSDILLNDPSTELTVALQNKVNKNIILNGGRLILDDNVQFADDVRVTESGTVQFNGNQLSLGGKDLIWSGTMFWDHATDMVLNSDVAVVGQWIFWGDAHVIGNGNALDLTSGGTIWIKHDTRVDFSDIKIRGLGLGWIVFEDKTSQMGLSQAEIEMDRDYTVTNGGIYVDGTTTVNVKDRFLIFDQQGSLTVDGVALIYDTFLFDDRLNIKPNLVDDPSFSHITYLNDGIIRRYPVLQALGDLHLNLSTFFTDIFVASPYKRIFFDETLILDGKTYPIIFTRADQNLLFVAAGKTATLTNIVLEGFSPDYVNYGAGSSLIFADKTTIELGKNEDLNTTWTFRGACVLNGKGQCLNLDALGEIVIDQPGSSLLFDNIILTGVSDHKIRCLDNTNTISFKNVRFVMDDSYSFSTGHFEVLANLDIAGTYTFEYRADKQSIIYADARMVLDLGTTFSYAPTIDNRDLMVMVDTSAQLYMNGATLASTVTGMRLTNGTFIIDQKNFIRNDGAVIASEGISFGNGTALNDLQIKMMPAANIELLSGHLDYNNVN